MITLPFVPLRDEFLAKLKVARKRAMQCSQNRHRLRHYTIPLDEGYRFDNEI